MNLFKDPMARAEYKARIVRWYDSLSASRSDELKALRALLTS